MDDFQRRKNFAPPLADAFIENASLCFLKIGQTYCEYNVRKDLKNIFT